MRRRSRKDGLRWFLLVFLRLNKIEQGDHTGTYLTQELY